MGQISPWHDVVTLIHMPKPQMDPIDRNNVHLNLPICLGKGKVAPVMGNKFTRRRHQVDERYTKPQGLYQHRDVDHKKLRKLIIDAKLAPCYPGAEDSTADLDECPICFLYYPSLNRSKCCTKGICTECFLQMKSPNAARPAQCPFCKTPNYAVEYRGAKTQEEKGAEQAEEQKVIEAKIRMRQQELQAEEERVQTRQEDMRAIQIPQPFEEAERQNLTDLDEMAVADRSSTLQPSWVNSGHDSYGTAASVQNRVPTHILHGRHNRNEDFDLDLEDIMVMEAIWLSIQEHDSQRLPPSMPADIGNILAPRHSHQALSQETGMEYNHESIPGNLREMVPRSSVTGGLASAIATLAEQNVFNAGSTAASQNHQHRQISVDPGGTRPREGETNSHHNLVMVQDLSSAGIHENPCEDLGRENCRGQGIIVGENSNNTELQGRRTAVYAPEELSEVSLESRGALTTRLRDGSQGSMSDGMPDHSSEAVEVGTSFSSSVPSTSDLPWESSDIPKNVEIPFTPPAFSVQPPVVPESFEEQMMLAMALSIAEAQARS